MNGPKMVQDPLVALTYLIEEMESEPVTVLGTPEFLGSLNHAHYLLGFSKGQVANLEERLVKMVVKHDDACEKARDSK